ncbi:MAG: hydrogenase [Candidatus Omnitrophica bacterium]|nr:hydrogenase [Candidatus Omnitrophota bacterium]MDD5437323.1 hydrogenase [Candidatus Omnitrophota bacterium]
MQLLLTGILFMTFVLAISKRLGAMIGAFRAQSLFLFFTTLYLAMKGRDIEIYIVAFLLLSVKVIAIPRLLSRMVKRIKAEGAAGLFVNPTLSIFIAMFLTYLSYLFTRRIMPFADRAQGEAVIISLAVTLIGLFIMVSRMKAISQIVGLLVMENGLFLVASSVSGGMPFFVEIAIFFDIFVCVIILGMFVYKINKVFTHIDVNKMRELKG